jgi:penicillin-binding protein 1C
MNLIQLKVYIRKYKNLYSIILLFLIIYFFCLPRTLFSEEYSTVIYDREGDLVGARIASDGQWRFPEDSAVSDKFKTAIVTFEDQYFRYHPGFNPVSLFRSAIRNLRAHKIVSGGSTISMQVIRLYRDKKKRTVLEKILETFLSTRLEFGYSKNDILRLYSSHAPFGGNVVGIDAASWRYFGRSPKNLSWAEAALLAVLPNSPSMIHPGKNRQNLEKKRNRLLQKLYYIGAIDQEMYKLSLLEPLPLKPLALPDICPHLTEILKAQNNGKAVKSSIKKSVQDNINRMVSDYYYQLKVNEIHNACVVVIEVNTGNVLAYVGNIPQECATVDGQNVDLIQASRSTGSILKPLLYTAMIQEGIILPGTLIPDIPTRIAGFKPDNYDLSFDGAVPAKRALARSLNIPAVRMLQSYGIPKFQNFLQKLGMTTLVYSPDHYGLTLIVGGAEGKLWDLTGIYAGMARTLNYYNLYNDYSNNLLHIPNLTFSKGKIEGKNSSFTTTPFLNAGAIWSTFDALIEVNRPDEEAGWVNLSSSRKIAWKTGTSYGFRDAWAIGTTPEYVVGVWVGNADGEGRPGLTGVGAAAPLLFRVFNSLPQTTWFDKPFDELEKEAVCKQSGYRAGTYCDEIDSSYLVRAGLKTEICPYHILVHLSADGKYRVSSKCEDIEDMIHKHWFVLPPAMEWFYRRKNVFYSQLPPLKPGCLDEERLEMMELVYPTDVLKIFIPREIDGTPGRTVFEIAHRNTNAVIYWHIDKEYVGLTKGIHQISVAPAAGKHLLTVVDNNGRTLSRWFEVVDTK